MLRYTYIALPVSSMDRKIGFEVHVNIRKMDGYEPKLNSSDEF
jgi:hypothetical protein